MIFTIDRLISDNAQEKINKELSTGYSIINTEVVGINYVLTLSKDERF